MREYLKVIYAQKTANPMKPNPRKIKVIHHSMIENLHRLMRLNSCNIISISRIDEEEYMEIKYKRERKQN